MGPGLRGEWSVLFFLSFFFFFFRWGRRVMHCDAGLAPCMGRWYLSQNGVCALGLSRYLHVYLSFCYIVPGPFST